MKLATALLLILPLMGCATGKIDSSDEYSLSSLSDEPFTQLRNVNKKNIAKLKRGLSRVELLSTFGGEFTREIDTVDRGIVDLKQPHSIESYYSNNSEIEVIYYESDLVKSDNQTTDNELTPVVLIDGVVDSWGWADWSNVRINHYLKSVRHIHLNQDANVEDVLAELDRREEIARKVRAYDGDEVRKILVWAIGKQEGVSDIDQSKIKSASLSFIDTNLEKYYSDAGHIISDILEREGKLATEGVFEFGTVLDSTKSFIERAEHTSINQIDRNKINTYVGSYIEKAFVAFTENILKEIDERESIVKSSKPFTPDQTEKYSNWILEIVGHADIGDTDKNKIKVRLNQFVELNSVVFEEQAALAKSEAFFTTIESMESKLKEGRSYKLPILKEWIVVFSNELDLAEISGTARQDIDKRIDAIVEKNLRVKSGVFEAQIKEKEDKIKDKTVFSSLEIWANTLEIRLDTAEIDGVVRKEIDKRIDNVLESNSIAKRDRGKNILKKIAKLEADQDSIIKYRSNSSSKIFKTSTLVKYKKSALDDIDNKYVVGLNREHVENSYDNLIARNNYIFEVADRHNSRLRQKQHNINIAKRQQRANQAQIERTNKNKQKLLEKDRIAEERKAALEEKKQLQQLQNEQRMQDKIEREARIKREKAEQKLAQQQRAEKDKQRQAKQLEKRRLQIIKNKKQKNTNKSVAECYVQSRCGKSPRFGWISSRTGQCTTELTEDCRFK